MSKTKKNVRFSFIDIFQAFDVRLETSRVDCKVLDVLQIRSLFNQSFIYLFIYLFNVFLTDTIPDSLKYIFLVYILPDRSY